MIMRPQHRLTSCWFLLLTLLTASVSAQDIPTVEEFIQRLPESQSLPVQYRISRNGANAQDVVVSQKRLKNGVLATRTEAIAPSQTIMLLFGEDIHGEEIYEILPQSEVVIDKNLIPRSPVTGHLLRSNETSLCYIPSMPLGAKIVSQKVSATTLEGVACFELVTEFSLFMGDMSVLPSILQIAIPRSHTLVVNAETFDPLEFKCHGVTGVLLQSLKYLEVKRHADISDDLFTLPDHYLRLRPASVNEYYDLHEGFWSDLDPKPQWKPRFPRQLEPQKYEYKIDKATGIPQPLATNPEQKRLLDQHYPQRVPPPSGNRWVRLFVWAHIPLVVGLLYLAFRRSRKRKAELA